MCVHYDLFSGVSNAEANFLKFYSPRKFRVFGGIEAYDRLILVSVVEMGEVTIKQLVGGVSQ